MTSRPLVAAGTLLGVGMGGFLDGIIFHQVLQMHSMLSAQLPQDTLVNVKSSMVGDGLFHLLTWIATAIAIMMLWHAMMRQDGKNQDWLSSVLRSWAGEFSTL